VVLEGGLEDKYVESARFKGRKGGRDDGKRTLSLLGSAPTTVPIFSPFLKSMKVGMALIPTSPAISCSFRKEEEGRKGEGWISDEGRGGTRRGQRTSWESTSTL
jgi:hypothetical protein